MRSKYKLIWNKPATSVSALLNRKGVDCLPRYMKEFRPAAVKLTSKLVRRSELYAQRHPKNIIQLKQAA